MSDWRLANGEGQVKAQVFDGLALGGAAVAGDSLGAGEATLVSADCATRPIVQSRAARIG